MTKKEWLQALLDGKAMTSDYANGHPIIFYEGTFMYKNTSEVVSVNLHNHGLKEYFEYPMWFEHKDKDFTVKFTALTKGVVVQANKYRKVGYSSTSWVKHTDKDQWVQTEEPEITKELTMKELEAHYGCKIKIVKD